MSSWQVFTATGTSNRLQNLCATTQYFHILKRWKKTKKKFTTPGIHRKTDPNALAMKHFDENYQPHFRELWPMIRLGLLSRNKYGALVNNHIYSATSDSAHIVQLESFGAVDVVRQAANKELHSRNLQNSSREDVLQPGLKTNLQRNASVEAISTEYFNENQDDESPAPVSSSTNDDSHSPSRDELELKQTTSEYLDQSKQPIEISGDQSGEKKLWWEDQFIVAPGYEANMEPHMRGGGGIQDRQSLSRAPDIDTISKPFQVNPNLKCYVHHDEANVKPFPRMKGDPGTGLLTYYAMDAASILPVLALDVRPEDTVLDLCAAPGGKTLALLQTMFVGGLRANEPSKSRRLRLSGVLSSYIPTSFRKSGAISLSSEDGRQLGQMEPNSFEKVLVDVPCTNDRQSVLDPKDNIFTPYRSGERKDLPKLQRDLLCAALQAVKPGGDVVYSTCTLSPAQNDDVIENAIYTSRSQHRVNAVVVDLLPLTYALGEVFHFWKNCRYGQLVLPGLRRNFGPMYFCRLHRTK